MAFSHKVNGDDSAFFGDRELLTKKTVVWIVQGMLVNASNRHLWALFLIGSIQAAKNPGISVNRGFSVA